MGLTAPGNNVRSAPFSRTYTTFATDRDLTEEVSQAQRAASGLLVYTDDTDQAVEWKDCSGTVNTVTFAVSGLYDLPVAATVLGDGTTAASVTVYWHS